MLFELAEFNCSSEAVEVDCLGFLIFAWLVGGMEFSISPATLKK